MSTLHLRHISIGFGLLPLVDDVSFNIFPKDRLCIIGRNGVGKSTLLKMIDGKITPDAGEIQHEGSLVTALLSQEMPETSGETLYDMMAQSLNLSTQTLLASWEILPTVDAVLSKLGLHGEARFNSLSGGFKRRVLLASALVHQPDILLMDEPTNHLDISGIEWLEKFIHNFRGTVVFITHDRTFLKNIATRIIELDRGKLLEFPGNYDNYLEKKAAFLEAQETEFKKFDKHLADEEVWTRQGIKARRTRNEGRVRALEALRQERQARRNVIQNVQFSTQRISDSGKLVIEASHLSYAYPNKTIVRDFSTQILRGDKIGLIGDNGVGKTTLIQLLLTQLTPDKGHVKLGTKLEIAYFDQHRSQLELEKTVVENISHGDQYVMYNQKSMHVMSYLKQFLFSPERAHTPVKVLSGGERNRLLLAKLFSKPANFLVLDEPTNDLDFETLELLEDLLVNYTGTLLLVSHDRTFLNHVITSAFVFEGDGKITEYIGGYDDIQTQQKAVLLKSEKFHPKMMSDKIDYQRQKEIKALENKIETLENKIRALEETLATPTLYEENQKNRLAQIQKEHETLKQTLQDCYKQWEHLMRT